MPDRPEMSMCETNERTKSKVFKSHLLVDLHEILATRMKQNGWLCDVNKKNKNCTEILKVEEK